MSQQGEHKREYERYNASLKVQISAFDSTGEKFSETGVLQNISGGGANLVAGSPERYFIGQKVDLKIYLPHSDELNTAIGGHGMIVWTSESVNPADGPGRAHLGVALDDLLAFEHIVGEID
jgi:hypothetical protein